MNNKFEIWTEKYRPKKIEDYVFRDQRLKEKIIEWIKNPEGKRIPFENIMLTGHTGVGKCLDFNEQIKIKIGEEELILPIGEIYNTFVGKDSEYYTAYPVLDIKIETEDGFAPILYLIKKRSIRVIVTLLDGRKITCSTEHLVFENDICKKIVDCSSVDTLDGNVTIQSFEYLSESDVYDVSIPAPHRYITPNGIIHHNTSLARMLCNELDIDPGDVMEINASRENNADTIREKIVNYCSTWANGDYKVIILDECDRLSPLAQDILRAEIEKYYDSVRFIGTCNHPRKLSQALHSRFELYHFEALDMNEFVQRIIHILNEEKVEYESEDLLSIIDASYPDLRKCINLLSQHTVNRKLGKIEKNEEVKDYLKEMVTLFKNKDYNNGRKLISANVKEDDIDGIFKYLYQNLDLFSKTNDGQGQAIMIIAEGLRDNTFVSDHEINLSCALVKLSNIDV